MKRNKKTMTAGVFWHGALLFIIVIIFGNSLMKPEHSYSSSAAVTQMITSAQGEQALLWEYIFRKFAHVVEFTTLGCVSIFVKTFYFNIGKRINTLAPWFFLLLVGVVDEWLQMFSGRSSAVSDVVLDFVSGVAGMAIAIGIIKLKKALNKRRNLL